MDAGGVCEPKLSAVPPLPPHLLPCHSVQAKEEEPMKGEPKMKKGKELEGTAGGAWWLEAGGRSLCESKLVVVRSLTLSLSFPALPCLPTRLACLNDRYAPEPPLHLGATNLPFAPFP